MPYDNETASRLGSYATGEKLGAFLARSKMQQKELAQYLGVEASYISRMVKGHVNWVNGRYFGQIASKLRLTNDEIAELNPAAVVNFSFMSAEEHQKVSTFEPVQPTERVYFSGEVFGDMHIPQLPPPFVMALYYDEKSSSGLILSKDAGGNYWLYLPERVPSSHTVLGAFAELHLEADASARTAP